MLTTHTITIHTPTGAHTAVHVPPPSRQPKAKASRYNLSSIMTRAWAEYRKAVAKGWTTKGRFDARRWAFCLGTAWGAAKAEVEHAERLAAIEAELAAEPVVTIRAYANPATRARIEAINGELAALRYSDCPSVASANRERDLHAELERLGAVY